ncbi:MAG: glycerol-3-phosphate dehydrogenase [Gammaproteobacteria bacterium]|nr:glycerol-3-phosphate dehydrogenase [Gammaproteobacteria bacterium]
MNPTHNRPYDLFVIGGGINGAAIACDAAGRGLCVALVEMHDFAEGTSSRSSKLIHGGLRYLETYDFKMVREALIEREVLMFKAPHLVWPLRLVLPHVASQRPRWVIRLGLFLYDHLARRNHLPASESVDLHHDAVGRALKPSFRHAFAYSDCRGDDARLVIANLLGAQRHGTEVLPRHEFMGAERTGDLWQICLRNVRTDVGFSVFAKALVNAAGPWVVDVVDKIAGVTTDRQLRMVRGSHIVVPRQWDGEHAYFLQTQDARTMEVFPYEEDFTSIGTTDEPWEEEPAKVEISDKEIDYMLEQVNEFLRRPIRREDIVWSYSGVRPLFEMGSSRDKDLSTLTRDYSFEVDHNPGRAPALIVFGGKLTTHRRLAEHAMQTLCKLLPWPVVGRTDTEILPGGDFGSGGIAGYERDLRDRYPWLPTRQIKRYVRLYGTCAENLIGGSSSLQALGDHFGSDLYQREVDYLIATEWACTVDDIIWRRTKLGLRLSAQGIDRLGSYLGEVGCAGALKPTQSG